MYLSHEADYGLSEAEAAKRLAAEGSNTLPPAGHRALFVHLTAQFVHFFALMLWAASGLAFLAGMPQLAVAIIVVVVVNGLFAFWQEHRAARAAERLAGMVPQRATVIRDGRRHTVDARDVVRGDLLVFAAGDRVPADATVVVAEDVALDTSILTGESVPISVGPGDGVHAGMLIVAGEARARVTETGRDTRLAAIALLTRSSHRPRTPLARELDRVVHVTAAIALGVGSLFFVVSVLVGSSLQDAFLFGVGVTVALVPEGLLPSITLSLAAGGQRMAAHHALVRRLDAVESLGATTFICTDKTGTLTSNEMAVVAGWTPGTSFTVTGRGYSPEGSVECPSQECQPLQALALAAARCSDGKPLQKDGRWVAEGDPMEAAIRVFARRLGVDVDADEQADPEVERQPFDPHEKFMAVVTQRHYYVKGAPEVVLAQCGLPIAARDAADDLARRGLRVLAVAKRAGAGADEGRMALLGLLGFEDPPRPEVTEAIAACRRAQIKVAMLTGDHPITARAIAEQIGLRTPGAPVLQGGDLPRDIEVLGALIDRDGVVISRLAPEDKLRIAEALQRRGHVVAMTGDGVNDGPALQKADVGVAMGRTGTDVAREAADLVLLDDNFATIVRAVEEGRTTFANIRRFLTYHLTDNVAELTPFVIWALSGGQFPLALGVVQILCLDVGTDLLPALALGSERSHQQGVPPPLGGRRLIDRPVLERVFGVLGPTEATVEMLAFLAAFITFGWRPGEAFPGGEDLAAASGAAFAAVVLGQAGNAFACRSSRATPMQLGWLGNRFLLAAVAVELALLVAFLGIPPLAEVLDHAVPPWPAMIVAALAFPAVIAVDALHKSRRTRGAERLEPAR